MIRTRKLIKRSQKRGLPALLLMLALVAVIASILITQSPENKAEASRYGTCPAGQVQRGQRLSSGGYRIYCVATTTTRPPATTTRPRPSSCQAGYYRWSFGSRGGCAPCPSTATTMPPGCSGYTTIPTPTTRPPTTTQPPATTRPTPTTRPPTTTTTTRPRPSSCQAGYYLSLIHISEPTRLRRISYAVFCLKKKK